VFVTLNEDGHVQSHHFSCFAFGVCCAQVVLYMHVKLMCSFYDCRCGSKKLSWNLEVNSHRAMSWIKKNNRRRRPHVYISYSVPTEMLLVYHQHKASPEQSVSTTQSRLAWGQHARAMQRYSTSLLFLCKFHSCSSATTIHNVHSIMDFIGVSGQAHMLHDHFEGHIWSP
jgi:hypothetical protein